MNRDPGPLSPDSIGGASEWSGISKYQGIDEVGSPYSAGTSPNPNSRGQLISPPISNGSNIAMNGGYQGPPLNGAQNAPSPPASIARSSIPTSLYAGSTTGSIAGGRERTDNQFEGVLSEHYVALKRFLAAALRDEKANPRPNKARDKLLRLSPVQFQELSTDVFDELLRRQSASRRQPSAGGMNDPGVPAYLLPKDTFHPKRNQARQKLSTLPPPRFRDLATDVFYELERRFPHFATGEMSRNGTPTAGPGGFRPDSRGQPRIRRPSDASSIASYSSRGPRDPNAPQQSPGMPPGSFGREPNNFGRPLPKTFQSNTLVPNKSTMVEDDDDDADSFSVRSGPGMGQNGPPVTSEVKFDEHWGKRILLMMLQEDKKKLADYEAQLAELKEKVDGLKETLRRKDEELDGKDQRVRSIESSAATEKKELQDLRLKLEDQLADAQHLNTQLQSELDRLRSDHADTEHSLRHQLEQLSLSGGTGANDSNEELMQENEQLRRDLREQQELSDDVRVEAQNLLQEMKVIAEQKSASWEQEQALVDQVAHLQKEVEEWKNRYSRTKTQLRSVRASSIGLTIQPHLKHSGEHDSPAGLVEDVHVTKFQISIDELLRTARSEKPAETIEYTKNVIKAVLKITKDIDDSVPGGKLNDQQARLKHRVSNTANNLFIASKNFVDAKGLSPVSLLDAAASHITTAVVELVRTVKIRPSPPGEYDEEETMVTLQPLGNKTNGTAKPTSVPQLAVRDSNQSSLYSAATSPHVSQQPAGHSMTPSEAEEYWRERQRSMSGNSGALGLGLGINGNQQHTLIPIRGGGGRESALSATDDIDELKVNDFMKLR